MTASLQVLSSPDARESSGATDPWGHWLEQVAEHIQGCGWHASRTVVLVPFAQMMAAGRDAWQRHRGGGFPPRFESTRNWANGLRPFAPGPLDVSGDTARDSLIAANLLEQVAGRRLDADLRASLVARLVEAARQLAPLAAAQSPEARQAWAQALRPDLVPPSQVLQWEGLVASVALSWVGVSAFATDVLWSDQALPGGVADGLLAVPGFQADPLADALIRRWGARGLRMEADPSSSVAASGVLLHACGDAEDEAQRAAACIIRQVNAGRVPLALVAQDRALTRRIGAHLGGAGLAVRDETGWKLSTTHAAARLMSLLRAADPRARTDDVLDWLKQGPQAVAVLPLERLARSHGLSSWGAVCSHPDATGLVPPEVVALLASLQSGRGLLQWLQDLASTLRQDGWWDACHADEAGRRVIEVLRLAEGACHELAALTQTVEMSREGPVAGRRWSLQAFTAWVRDALEAASFQPNAGSDALVVVLPMAQLLGRPFAAVIVPGCDEVHLPPSPEPPGQWSAAQRQLLGLPVRAELAQAAHAAWLYLLRQPGVQLLWRSQHQGEVVSAGPWVQILLDGGSDAAVLADESRHSRTVPLQPTPLPAPTAADLLPQVLSASAYQDLRDCPYRFFALRQLRLQQVDEIEAEPDKRDLGNWLHAVLKAFHESRAVRPGDGLDDRQRLDALAQAEARARGLSVDNGEAGFLPFMAAWPALREGYLAWLASHEGSGPVFDRAEVSLSRNIGPWRLVGQLDRIDRQVSPEGPIPLVIDYKTEPRATTLERVKDPMEDTQIAFYAALLGDETVRGAYLSVTDAREADGANTPTRWVEQEEIALARDQLIEGLQDDLSRVAEGHALPALGEGRVCEFCAARGLCRKDFRS